MFSIFYRKWIAFLTASCFVFLCGCAGKENTEIDKENPFGISTISPKRSISATKANSPDALKNSSHATLQEKNKSKSFSTPFNSQKKQVVVKRMPNKSQHETNQPEQTQEHLIKKHKNLLKHTKFYSSITKGIGFRGDDGKTFHFVDIHEKHWNAIVAARSTTFDPTQAAQELIHTLETAGNTVVINNETYRTKGKLGEGAQAWVYLIKGDKRSFVIKIDKGYPKTNLKKHANMKKMAKKVDEEYMLHYYLRQDVPNNTVRAWNYNVGGCFVTIKDFVDGSRMKEMLEGGNFKFTPHGKKIVLFLKNMSKNFRVYRMISSSWPITASRPATDSPTSGSGE
ncbi:MAG: hypothetical protein AAF320_05775 [Myxococcota bacterium]